MPSPPGSSPDSDGSQWDPQVIALVGLVCSMVVLFTYFKMIECNCFTLRMIHLSRRSEQRRRLNRHLEEFSDTFQSRGLDSFVMHSLPITRVNKDNGKESWHPGSTTTECAVCLGEFQDGEWVKHLPSCSHVFHVSCIDTWFQTHASCPLCRSYVVNIVSTPNGSPMTPLRSLDREDYRRERLEHFQTTQSHSGSGDFRHD